MTLKTPLRQGSAAGKVDCWIFHGSEPLIKLPTPEDAAFIVTAVNSHDALVAALELARRFRATSIVDDDFPAIRDEFDKALAEALGK